MERIHQMKVIPDIVPDFHPSLDLRVVVPTLQPITPVKRGYKMIVEPGVYLEPHQTIQPPRLHLEVFHPENMLYTMIMIDPGRAKHFYMN